MCPNHLKRAVGTQQLALRTLAPRASDAPSDKCVTSARCIVNSTPRAPESHRTCSQFVRCIYTPASEAYSSIQRIISSKQRLPKTHRTGHHLSDAFLLPASDALSSISLSYGCLSDTMSFCPRPTPPLTSFSSFLHPLCKSVNSTSFQCSKIVLWRPVFHHRSSYIYDKFSRFVM